MAINSQLLATESKKQTKLSKHQNRNRIIDMEIIWRVMSWEGEGKNGGKGAGNKKHSW